MENKTTKHCKREYKVITPFTNESLLQVIEVMGKNYLLTYLPRPCKNEADLFAVYYGGVRFPSLAKFLKSIY